MKKTTLFAALVCAMMSTPTFALAQMTGATEKIYDFAGYSDEKILELFAKVLKENRQFPTIDEFKSIGIQPADLAFVRSHVRPRAILSQKDRLVQDTREGRQLWMNTPTGLGKVLGEGGYPNANFTDDVFSMWNYTQLYGAWNHGLFQAPGAWVDAAHKNGTDIFSGIKFFDTTGNPGGVDASGWMKFVLTKNEKGEFTYAEPLINALMYFGSDGINYNWEAANYDNEDVIAFHKKLWKIAEEKNFVNYHSAIYTNLSGISNYNANALFGDNSQGGKTHDLMLNYVGNDITSTYQMQNSINAAESKMGTTDGLYAGVYMATMERAWQNFEANPKMNICLWGEHDQSRFMSYNAGDDAYDVQRNYQMLLERAFTGGYRTPLKFHPVTKWGNNWEKTSTKLPLETFFGFAKMIPERSAIQGNLPFSTRFNLGNGERFYYKGKRTAGSWYNISAQDVVPTYRWLIYQTGTKQQSDALEAEFTHKDAYTGGSCLLLKGKAAGDADVVLYKTALKVDGNNPVVKIAAKKRAAGDSKLFVILQVNNEWKEIAYGAFADKTWEEKTLPSGLSQGDVITAIGLRVKGADSDYAMHVGKLEISDDTYAKPADVKDLTVEIKQETKESLTAKLFWTVDAEGKARKDQGLVYNDEANIDHFEVLYKDGVNGKVTMIGMTSQWAALVPRFDLQGATEPYFGIRAVSTDLKSYSAPQWVKITRNESAPSGNVYDPYGLSYMNPNWAHVEKARESRYLTSVTTTGATENLNYSASGPVADGSQYADARSHVLKVQQGQEITLNLKAFNSSTSNGDGLKWCFGGGWIDFDDSKDFNPAMIADKPEEGECIFRVGKSHAGTDAIEAAAGLTYKFTVPQDAKPGPSRLRIVFSDAWNIGSFAPVGLTGKGFTIDFSVQIEGTNAGRVYNEHRDQGDAEQPERIDDAHPNLPTAIERTQGANVSTIEVDQQTLRFHHVEKAWVYAADGKFVAYSPNGAALDISHLSAGTYVVKMQNERVIRSAKFVKE